jgi:16S rRNA (guanine1207-N2)-methyltransferase
MTLALVSGMVAADGVIVLAGTNDAGIRSARDAYEKNIGPVERKIVGNHSALYVGRNKKLGAGKTWRDFLSFSALSYERDGRAIEIDAANLPGVFSTGELDEGTKALLDNIPFDRASVLDIGCGAGVIGAIYKKISQKSAVTMSDSSMLAVRASEETLKKNFGEGSEARVVLSDVFDGIVGAFDLILCNPPFHNGVRTDYSFIERFARDAKKHLNRKGEVYVVANSFLPYQETLAKHIGPTDIVYDGKKFRVFRATAL